MDRPTQEITVVRRVTPKEAKQLMDEGWTYVDVRSEREFEQGHPAGALNLPFMHTGPGGMVPNPRFQEIANRVLSKTGRYILGCQSGGRSARAARALEPEGLTLVDQLAGFGGARDPSGRVVEPGWAASALPVENGQPSERCYADLVRKAGG